MGIGVNTADNDATNKHDGNTDQQRNPGGIDKRQLQAQMLQTFQQRDHGNNKTNQQDVERNQSFGLREGIFVVVNKVLNGFIQNKGNTAGNDGRHYPAGGDVADFAPFYRFHGDTDGGKTYDGTHDRVRRRYRPATIGSD